jgi:hypothetical protein
MRKKRYLVLAVLASLAVAAVAGPAPASAAKFYEEGTPETIKIEGSSGMEFVFASGVNCSGIYPPGKLASESEVSAPLPTTFTCSGKFGPYTLKSEECSASFSVANGKSGAFGLTGAGCKLDLQSTTFGCTFRFGPQTIPAAFKNEKTTPQIVSASSNSQLHYNLLAGAETPCGKKEGSLGFAASWNLRAFAGSKQIGISVGEGVWFNGVTSLFQAEEYPTNVTGGQDPASVHVLTFPSGFTMKCSSVTFSSQLVHAASALSTNAAYSGCTSNLLGIIQTDTVKMNSCSYVLSAGKWPAAGTLGVSCEEAGDGIEITLANQGNGIVRCRYKIGPQNGLVGVNYTTVEEGTHSGIGLAMNVKGIAITSEINSLLCVNGGTTGTYSGGTTLRRQ